MKNPVFVDNWKLTRERWLAFWKQDYIGRPILQMGARKKNAVIDPVLEAAHKDPFKRHADYEHICQYGIYNLQNTRFIAEGLPLITPGSSVGHALYFGCRAQPSLGSMWCDPLPVGESGLPLPEFSRDNTWYCWFRNATRHFAAECDGRYFTVPNFGNLSADTLALIRGTEDFMMDLYDRPEWIQEQDRMICDVLLEVFLERFEDIEKSGAEGYLNEALMWSPKRSWGVHCDISYMVSGDVFNELLWPSQKRFADIADYAYYHVDGPGVLRHLDVILNEPRIQAVQWLPGDGHNHPMQWLEVYRKIQDAGRSVQIFCPYDEVLPLLNEIKPGGVCIYILDCPDEDAGYALVEQVERFYQ